MITVEFTKSCLGRLKKKFPNLELLLGLGLWGLSAISPAVAQIVEDNTLGNERSVVTSVDNIRGSPGELVQGGAARGTNLFHSFQKFNVNEGQRVYFANPNGIENILNRITGNHVSNILGTLGVNGGANLFLLNPNGIIFGKNARLDVAGSFFASTADSLVFGNGFKFSANNSAVPPLLTVNTPIGFQFRDKPGNISNQSVAVDLFSGNPVGLQVPSGKSLALLGGNIEFKGGRLTAAEGRVELGGLAGAGLVGLTLDGNIFKVSFSKENQLANVTLAEDARISVRGEGGGDIFVNANTFTARDGGRLVAGTEGASKGGNIFVTANNVNLSGEGANLVGSGLYNQALPGSTGNAGNILINTRSFSAVSGATIKTNTAGIGNSGNVEIISTDSVKLIDGNIETITSDSAIGNAGNISITTGDYLASGANGYLWSGTVLNGENAGNILINANSVTLANGSSIDSSNRFGSGNPGTVEINANKNVSFSEGSFITSQSSGQGNGGNVRVQAGGSVSLVNSDIFTTTLLESNGQAGDINIQASSLSLIDASKLVADGFENSNAGNITVQTLDFLTLDNNSQISVTSRQAGGNIFLETGQLNVRNGSSLFASVLGDQPAGKLTVNASESVEVSDASKLSIDTIGNGNAGSLTINTRRLTVQEGSKVSTSTLGGSGSGGNLEITASDLVEVTGTTPNGLTSSGIEADTGGTGTAGNIKITTPRLMIRDGSRVSSFTVLGSSGQGGTVEVNASELVEVSGIRPNLLASSSLDTSSDGTGSAGDIKISTGRLIVWDGGKISTSTSGFGSGGNLAVNASKSVEVIGFSRVFPSELTTQTSGAKPAGNLRINTDKLLVQDRGRVTVSSLGTGTAGNMEIEASYVRLNNFGSFKADTTGGQGNINLQTDNLIMLGNSNITTNARGSATGGNITLNTENLVAEQNSDISANAEDSFGGRIVITAQGIFGTQFRDRLTPKSDITATSALGPEFNGTVTINTPDTDPNNGLTELPTDIVDASGLINQDFCTRAGGSKFSIIGKGGIALSPNEPQSADLPWDDLRLPTNIEVYNHKPAGQSTAPSSGLEKIELSKPQTIVEAQGWVMTANGKVVLTASPVKVTPGGVWLHPLDCQMLRDGSGI